MRKIAILAMLLWASTQALAQQTEVELDFQHLLTQKAETEHNHAHPHHYFSGTSLVELKEIGERAVDVYLELTDESLRELDEHAQEEYVVVMHYMLESLGKQVRNIFVRSSRSDFRPVSDYIFEEDTPIAEYYTPENKDPFPQIEGNISEYAFQKNNPQIGQARPSGALSGKTVWLSPGHGWIYYTSLGRYATQRGNNNDMVEDFGTIEAVGYYLLKYLWNAGANVWMVRERDFNTNEVIVDNDSAASGYSETGSWSTSGSSGYGGGTYRFANTTATETATAIYEPNIPKEGWYWVSVYFREGGNRPVDTRYRVQHAGGETVVSISQEVHGQTWVYLGQFYFDAGTNGRVILTNESSDVGQALISDAVRFGGGTGTIEDCDVSGVGTSGEPRFEEGAQLFARYMGYPTCDGDVSIRPKYAEWELAKGSAAEQNNLATGDINSVYVSWHTNAGGGTGTSSFIYDPASFINDPNPNPTGCSGAPGGTASGRLRNFIHNEVISDVRAEYDPTWTDRGLKCANFGELRNLSTMPGALFEMGFHDNADDAEAITTPDYRKIVARAVYQGIVQFYNYYDNNITTTYLPEPPTHAYARNSGAGQVTLTWQAPPTGTAGGAAATGYKVYMSTHGKGFADGDAVTGTSYTVSGLQPSTTYYFRVAATNVGGESFPTSVVAVRTPPAGETATPFLIVDGFDRLQRSQMVYTYDSAPLGNLYRGFLEVMNSYTYMVEHARAMEACCDQAFDGASNEAVISGAVTLGNYELIDWICGEESTADNTLNVTERTLVQNFLDGGGNLIISGAEIGWDIGRSGSGNAAVSFYNNYLKATYAGDDGATYNFAGSGIYAGISSSFDNGTSCIYDVNFPDRLSPTAGATAVLTYSGGTGDGAAVAYKGSDFGVVNFGFPIETVTDAAVREELLCNAIEFLVLDDATVDCDATIIRAKAFLQGPYVGANMATALETNGIIPLTQPYTTAPFNYAGTESVTSIPANVVDWVLLQVRDPADNTNVLAERACFLRNDGELLDLDGSVGVRFPNLSVTSGFVSVKHRNHLGVMTNSTVSF